MAANQVVGLLPGFVLPFRVLLDARQVAAEVMLEVARGPAAGVSLRRMRSVSLSLRVGRFTS